MGDSETLGYTPGNLKGPTCIQGCVHYQETLGMAPISLLADLETLHKQKAKAKTGQYTSCQSTVYPNTHTASLGKDQKTHWLKAFKEISIQ